MSPIERTLRAQHFARDAEASRLITGPWTPEAARRAREDARYMHLLRDLNPSDVWRKPATVTLLPAVGRMAVAS